MHVDRKLYFQHSSRWQGHIAVSISFSSWACRAIKFKEDLDPELKAKLERRPSAAQALLAAPKAPHPPLTLGSQPLTAVPRRRIAEVLLLLA